MLSNNLFLKLPFACAVNNSTEQEYLYSGIESPFMLKMVLMILSHVHLRQNSKNILIELKDFKAKNSLFCKTKHSLSKIARWLNALRHPFINKIKSDGETVDVEFSDVYLKLLKQDKFVNIELEALMSYKKVSSIKLHIQLKAFQVYRANLFFLIDFLGVSTKQKRKDQIRSIKAKIRTVKIMQGYRYLYPSKNDIEAKRCAKSYVFEIKRKLDQA
ncbi:MULTISPECIES: hypothetical protein [Vibrio]|uniref:hypothetical protein n=1 Tax=Vibrio TaxID=662 RepID=UPI0005C9C55F|nr:MULTISPECIES: hypothetical protein [Vibrio]MCX9567607.1 hypothetical protein [Vibrio cholerae]MCX9572163.1 hypothetical protein [Vibrio cholerae]MCX9588611.1 hypothetical protein [Vibrio cholerae]